MLDALVPGVGLEPTTSCEAKILSLLRKPFRHPGSIHKYILFEATVGVAPTHNGFADRRVATSPCGR